MSSSEKASIQQENLKNLVNNGGFQFTEAFFPYTSGQIGPYYVQSIAIEKDGVDYAFAIDSLVKLTEMVLPIKSYLKNSDIIISGGESRDWDFSNPVAAKISKAHTKIYKNGKMLGADVNGKKVVHIADLNNEGSSPRDLWVPAIRNAGGTIENIFFYVDRMEDGVEEMKKLGLNSYAVINLDESAWDYLLKTNVINEKVHTSLRTRMEDKNKWARDMLRSERGLETLANLFGSKNSDKATKILTKGYPDMQEELLSKLKQRGTTITLN